MNQSKIEEGLYSVNTGSFADVLEGNAMVCCGSYGWLWWLALFGMLTRLPEQEVEGEALHEE
jgi:hypothetical protein